MIVGRGRQLLRPCFIVRTVTKMIVTTQMRSALLGACLLLLVLYALGGRSRARS